MKFKFKKSSGLPADSPRFAIEAGARRAEAGQVSKLLLVLAIIVLVAVVITYLVMRMATPPPKPNPNPEPTELQPVYSQTLGNIGFTFRSTIDMGNVLRAQDSLSSTGWQKDLATTERFIKVTIGAQNQGKENIQERSWDIGNIVDSEGRIYEPLEGYTISPWLPENNGCQALLKPAFEPVLCTKIYEVSKKSTGLKVNVIAGKDNLANNFSSDKVDTALIDLILK
ncbi:MAG: hypothetical protein A2402_02135 [Candidatus Staskawiczbacteria bacterium RIFOXYC1_FULL_37_43]|nr:MAG: hypothetical protein A2813_02135 [Candidatus Staskawiczbacteria bacterium RIFCSPHIGHO2_01_FULL_37_17]OGZ71255.1 MAG: hypothetical protein A2891_03260 [Candidatus Staskawiczbacteria bacterium RIFCSPLOWO2_01_FULL_37_19]OGZ75605.1 MAG: hypothetical protein A2205_00215 [Candidatus Staskawiczbacteria bacterium RIFOXYA1_FULL_37_15]OGZ76618.1 MAG: hypothetical protein A2280_04050 [Candidatus Staskawiczbacteria bacterium RIFOXYA12_FULL_37_10]OGZ79881.1 MAG: hypothetical protein A2353_01455 [Can